MILSPIFKPLLPKISSIKHLRIMRPIIKIGKEKFQVTIDVRKFNKDEIRVKARPEYVIIEGKQEKKTKKGYVLRQFVRKFKLPNGCRPENMETKLSTDGLLTITARRKLSDNDVPTETLIPIDLAEKQNKGESVISVQNLDSSNKYMKDKPEQNPDDSNKDSKHKPGDKKS